MKLMRRFTCIGLTLFTIFTSSQEAKAEPFRIGTATWVGFGPLHVADEKGFFGDEGVDVHLINFQAGSFDAVLDGQIDAAALDFMSVVRRQPAADRAILCIFALDDSNGGDGIVATHDIQSIADLEGKTVAFDGGGVSEFYLNVLLGEVGLTMNDIESVDLDEQDASEAFILQEVDATVTWEPHLSAAKNTDHGHLLTDSSDHPGLLADGLFALADVLESRREDFKAVARAWDRAVNFVEAHPDEAIEIMARNVGGWLEDPAEFAAAMEGVSFYDKTRNQEYFGTAESPGEIHKTLQHTIDVWSEHGRLKREDLTPADLIVHGIWDE